MSLNLFKTINNNIFKIGQSVSKDNSNVIRLTKEANELISTIKSKHSSTKISTSQLAVYNKQLNYLITNHNRIQRVAITAKKSIVSINKVISSLNVTVTTLSTIITVLQALPAPAQFTPIGVILTLGSRIKSASDKINDIKNYLGIATIVLKFLLEYFNKFLQQLEILNQLIQQIIELLKQKYDGQYNNTDLETDQELYANDLGNNDDFLGSYREYTFYLKTEDNPKYAVGDIKPKYAVATKDNRDVYFSEISYTLNPDILIQQLKLQIDTENN